MKLAYLTCLHCHQPFQKRIGAKYCSPSCRWRASNIRNYGVSDWRDERVCRCGKSYIPTHWRAVGCGCAPEAKVKDIFIRACGICKVEFPTHKNNQKYCSFICRRSADNLNDRKKDKKSRLAKKPCEFCGFTDIRAIHRHHINPQLGNAGGLMFLCANHHYIFHAIAGSKPSSENMTKEQVLSILKNSTA